MISYRLRGLINLHIVAAALIATTYFLVLALSVPYIPFLDLSKDLNLPLYAAPVMLGMLMTARFWRAMAARYHTIGWVDSAAVSSRQLLVVALMVFALIVATKDRTISRVFLTFFLASCWFLLLLVNRWLPAYLASIAFHEAHRIPAVFVGTSNTVGRLNAWMKQKESLGIHIVGLLSDDEITATASPFVPWLGHTAQLKTVIQERNVGQVILLEIPSEPARTLWFVELCQASGCRLLIYENLYERLPIPMAPVIEDNHLFLTVHEEPLEDPFSRGVKRIFDICIALPVVVVVLPVLSFIVWVVQRVQAPGPLIFRRTRGGHRGREFEMMKFRSMYETPPDAMLEAQQVKAGDSRIYPFGAFLRRTSLDEFPQFVNVLVGDMSIVGPRPHLPKHDTEFSLVAKTYRTRQLVKPGITGLAQVRGFRGEISDPEALRRRVQYDIEYITTWSVWLDAQITLKTLLQVFRPPKTAL